MNRQERRKAERTAGKETAKRIKELNKPATRLELFASMDAIDQKFNIVMKFLHSKYGEEFEKFINEAVDEKMEEYEAQDEQ